MDRAIGIGVTVIWAAALSLLVLSGCAAPQVAKAPPRWPAALVWSVVQQCGKARVGTLAECGCFAEALERVSPNPDTKATDAEMSAALDACGLSVPQPEPEDSGARYL